MLPVLYSFRRCPFAIRARMAIAYSGIKVELREVFLGNKPAAMLAASLKGTVPVLVLPDGKVIDESVDIMHWALGHDDPEGWWQSALADEVNVLLEENDFGFKLHLDHYKYSERYPQQSKLQYRSRAESFLLKLEQRLQHQAFLFGDQLTFSDIAIFPFIRQFASVDKSWFERSSYHELQHWLQYFLESSLFLNVMGKVPAWNEGDAAVLFPDG